MVPALRACYTWQEGWESRGQLTFTSTLCTPEEREPESAIPASELDRGGAGKTSNSVKDVLDAAAVQTNAI